MTKQEFIDALGSRLSGLPEKEKAEALAYYTEMLDDRIEDGMNEADAVHAIGTPEKIAEQVIADTPMQALVRERVKPRRKMRTWEIVLLAVGSPVWLSLAIAAIAVLLSLYIVLWTLVAVVWVVGAACAVGAVAGITCAVPTIFTGNVSVSLLYAGAGLVLAGLSIFAYIGARAATRGTAKLSKIIWFGLKRALVRKEAAA